MNKKYELMGSSNPEINATCIARNLAEKDARIEKKRLALQNSGKTKLEPKLKTIASKVNNGFDKLLEAWNKQPSVYGA